LAGVTLIGVEQHANRAHQQPAGGHNPNPARCEDDQPITGHLLKHRQAGGKVLGKVDPEARLNIAELQLEMADQLADNRPPTLFVGMADETTLGRQLIRLQTLLIDLEVAAVLTVQITDLTD